ncbi:MAG: OmpA family protein [Luteitalea sp.]|nr:OmpA family protein [Luteitalea sp.]
MSPASAQPNLTLPTEDTEGSQDNPVLKRYEGSFIVAYEQQRYAEFTLPFSPLELVPEKKDNHNNQLHEPKEQKALEGPYTRLVYLVPGDRSPLEVLRNYQDEIKGKSGKTLFECKDVECGGDPKRSSSGGGGKTSLAMYLYPEDRVAKDRSVGSCALTTRIADQHYAAAELPDDGAHVSVLTYTVNSTAGSCQDLNGRTVAVVDIVEGEAREEKMVTVSAEDMAGGLSSAGKVALYGIYFDSNKADVKPESAETLQEIAALLEGDPKLSLYVVGHTDSEGGYDYNIDLSDQRAASVVKELAAKHGVDAKRLKPAGVGLLAPVASNAAEEGRAKNRRVELVKQ